MELATIIELAANIPSLLCVWLTARRNIWAWPVGIVGILAFIYIFYQANLFGDMGLQFVYLAQSIYGWYYWLRFDPAEKALRKAQAQPLETGLHHISIQSLIFSAAAAILLFISLFWVLAQLVEGAAWPLWDALATTLSLLANIWLARKIIENWLLWIAADAILVGLFLSKNLYISATTYAIFLGMAVFGYWQWSRSAQPQIANAQQTE